MRGWKHVFYRIKVSFVFHFLRFKSKLHFTNRKLIDNCSLMDNIEFLLQLVINLSTFVRMPAVQVGLSILSSKGMIFSTNIILYDFFNKLFFST